MTQVLLKQNHGDGPPHRVCQIEVATVRSWWHVLFFFSAESKLAVTTSLSISLKWVVWYSGMPLFYLRQCEQIFRGRTFSRNIGNRESGFVLVSNVNIRMAETSRWTTLCSCTVESSSSSLIVRIHRVHVTKRSDTSIVQLRFQPPITFGISKLLSSSAAASRCSRHYSEDKLFYRRRSWTQGRN